MINDNTDGRKAIHKTRVIITIVVVAFIFINTFVSAFVSWTDTVQSNVQEVYPEIVSYSAEIVEQPTGYDEHDNDKKVIKITFELTNNTNERMIVSDGSYGYYYLDDGGYVQNLRKQDAGMIIDHYDNSELIPSGETVIHSEYIAIPLNATHVVYSAYSDDEVEQEYVMQF